jgi:Domain of unknown function (DUF4352)
MSTSSPVVARKKPFYKRWWVWLLALLAVIIVASAIAGGSSNTSSSTSGSATSEAQPGEQTAKVGEPARDGKFEFLVEGINCDQTYVGAGDFTHEAQGKYCIVRVQVTNIGDKSQTFSGSNVTLIDAAKNQFTADTGAAMYMDNAQSVFSPINPGNSVEAQVAFDVPRETVPDLLDLHDSPFSSGVRVQV